MKLLETNFIDFNDNSIKYNVKSLYGLKNNNFNFKFQHSIVSYLQNKLLTILLKIKMENKINENYK